MVTVTMARYDGGVGERRQPRCGGGGGCNDHQSLFSATFSKHFKLFRAPCSARYPAVGPKLSQVCAIGANSAPLFRRHLSSFPNPPSSPIHRFPSFLSESSGLFIFFFFFPIAPEDELWTDDRFARTCFLIGLRPNRGPGGALVIKNGHQKRPRATPRDTIKRTPAKDLERECC